MRYAAPEACDPQKAWPRRYDTWSYGCVILEFTVWVLEGFKGLRRFHMRIVDNSTHEGQLFETQYSPQNGHVSPTVHRAVLATMQSLSQRPECQTKETALGDLLENHNLALGVQRRRYSSLFLRPSSALHCFAKRVTPFSQGCWSGTSHRRLDEQCPELYRYEDLPGRVFSFKGTNTNNRWS